jgi:hypothetical protein
LIRAGVGAGNPIRLDAVQRRPRRSVMMGHLNGQAITALELRHA